jgi:hypothetical protein
LEANYNISKEITASIFSVVISTPKMKAIYFVWNTSAGILCVE